MATETTKLGLVKPSQSEKYNRPLLNENMEKIDQFADEADTAITALETDKVDKVEGKGLSTEDYTTAEKSKVANVPSDTNVELSVKVNKSRNLNYVNRPYVMEFLCNAGRFNFSWDNANGRTWVFPHGTVLNSDGVTPIRFSNSQQPDVILPSNNSIVKLYSREWYGNYTLERNNTEIRYKGSLADLPPLTYWLNLRSCSLVTGSLSDLPPLSYGLDLFDCSLVTGSLSDLPPLTYWLNLFNCSLVTGSYTQVSGTTVPTVTYLDNTGISAEEMDATLIAYSSCTKTGGIFQANGMTRTSASDSAVSHLTTAIGSGGLGWSVSGMTVV